MLFADTIYNYIPVLAERVGMQKKAYPRTISKWPVRAGIAVVIAASFLSCAPMAERIRKEVQRIEPILKSNSHYLLSVAKSDSSLAQPLDSSLADSISKTLESSVPVVGPPVHLHASVRLVDNLSKPRPEDLAHFSEDQLVRVYYLLKALQAQTFRKTIGEELEKDTKDKSREHGLALHLLENGTVIIEMIPSRRIDDDTYCPKKSQFSTNMLLPGHFHAAEEDETKDAVLSGGDWGACKLALFNEALFSRLPGGKFNVDVALWADRDIRNGNSDNDGSPRPVNLDLGVYGY